MENHAEERLDYIRDTVSDVLEKVDYLHVNQRVAEVATNYLSIFTATADEHVSLGERMYLAAQEVNENYENGERARGMKLGKRIAKHAIKISSRQISSRH